MPISNFVAKKNKSSIIKPMSGHYRQNRGFTITEILISVTILVVLGLIILVALNPMSQLFKGYDARRKADLAKIKIALENYYADHDCYPNFPKDADGKPTYQCGSDILSPYLESMPCDPNENTPYSIFYNPPNATCPQKFAVYAQIFSFFDQQANKYIDCSNTYAVYSSDMTYGEINYGCSDKIMCSQYYGCSNNACIPISIDDYASKACPIYYCEPDCNRNDELGINPCNDQHNWCTL